MAEAEARAARAQIAKKLMGKGLRWEAEHAEDEVDRTQAQLMLKGKEALDKLIDEGEPDRAWNREVSKNLEHILDHSDTHVASAECSKIACRVELIHEDDVSASEFTPERLMAAAPNTTLRMLTDRSEEDGQLRHYVYYRKP